MIYKSLDPEEFYLIDRFYAGCAVPRPDPNFSRIFAAIDDNHQVVGFVVLQLVAHAEPIYVDPAYRGSRVWVHLTAMLAAYCELHQIAGVYTQPTSDATRKICERMGWSEMDYPLYVRIFDSRFDGMIPPGPIDLDDPNLALANQEIPPCHKP